MSQPPLPPATLRLRIDSDALQENWRALDKLSGTARAGAAVKADAYGVGVDIAVPALMTAGARDFFVAHWSEVPAVLAYTAPENVAVLHGVSNEAEAAYARATGAIPVLNSLHQIGIWKAGGGGPCHVMLDSGMNRLGLSPADLGDAVLAELPIEVFMSHLASADEDSEQNERQLVVFKEAAALVSAKAYSLANSAGIALGREYCFDLTRPGLALYGGVPRPELASAIAQVVYPEAAILQLRDLQPGDQIGYNAQFTADRPMRAATISLGYADGFLRVWGGITALKHEGRSLPILGRISMDMVIVDCTCAPDLQEGDFVEVPYALPSAAKASGLSQYELLTILGNRFAR